MRRRRCRLRRASFNSRLREEATLPESSLAPLPVVSTHASVRRRHIANRENGVTSKFQLTPP